MTTTVGSRLESVLEFNSAYIPGGVSSINRIIDPPLAFVKGDGAYLWDIDGKRYLCRDLLQLRREQRQACAKATQPPLFDLKDDRRAVAERTAAGRYREPSLFSA